MSNFLLACILGVMLGFVFGSAEQAGLIRAQLSSIDHSVQLLEQRTRMLDILPKVNPDKPVDRWNHGEP